MIGEVDGGWPDLAGHERIDLVAELRILRRQTRAVRLDCGRPLKHALEARGPAEPNLNEAVQPAGGGTRSYRVIATAR
jgi:hypothetical protein